MYHDLDDILLISPVAMGAAQLDGLLAVFEKLGLSLAIEKLEAQVIASRIEVDTARLQHDFRPSHSPTNTFNSTIFFMVIKSLV